MESPHVGVAQATTATNSAENTQKARANIAALVPNSIHIFMVVEDDLLFKTKAEKFKDVAYLSTGSGEIIRHAQHTNEKLITG